MRKAFSIMVCVLLIGVLGCSDVVRYEPGYHEVSKDVSSADDVQDGHGVVSEEMPEPVMAQKDDVLQDAARH